MGRLTRGGMTAVVLRWASGLRFPWLFLLTASLFAVNLLIPDALPLIDEILMGLVALLLAGLRKKPAKDSVENTEARADTDQTRIVDDTGGH